jgi:Rrf2 family transcriptional regulator, nitric oxide-sensitive transcriptional repressor
VQLTTFTDYSLRVLISVGSLPERALTTIPEIAEQYGISRNHLVKVVHQLSRLGYLETTRGKGGGFKLAKPAAAIRLGDVIRDTESHFNLVPCFDSTQSERCAIEPACVLKSALRQAMQAFLAVTDDYTLEDLLRPRRRLRSLLAATA